MDELWSIVNEIGQHVSEWNAEEWAAAAGWATFLVAVIAGGIAWRQVREARTLRVEQAQPYVVAYMEQSPVLATAIELVVRNFGATAAHDVTLESTPGLRRTTDDQGGAEDVWVFDRLPLLAPGQEWRTVWDSSIRRFKTNLPDRHELVLRFKDSRKKSLKTEAVLDWSAYKGARYMKTYGIHHAAKALTGIVTEISKWREGAGRAGLKVFVRDGDARDEQARREFEAYRAEREAEQGASDQLLRYRNGKPITARRYDHLWSRLARHIPWVAAQQVSTHWLRHTTLTWVERNFGYAVARAYAGHSGRNDAATTATYVRADLYEVAQALAALTGEVHPLVSLRTAI